MMIRTRFAPSPTGNLHVGGIRTASYAYALAKHNKGDFILRIEDTDKKREVAGSKEMILDLLELFGLKWDELYVQSERVKTGIYKEAAEKLVEGGNAYYNEGAVRIKIPKNEKVIYHDFVLDKDIAWDTNTLEDLVLLKSDGFPTYHLAVVVDDHDMKISHVLRGHDWLPSTPLHLLVYKGLGYKLPEIGHLTDIMDPEGGKLSKRKGSLSIEGLLADGYLPEALLNFIILLGWAPKDNKEFFSLQEFVKVFDPKGFQKSNPVFNRDKLNWFNGEYIRQLSVEELNSKFEIQNSKFRGLDKEEKVAITNLVRDRIKTLGEFDTLAGFFFDRPKVDSKLLGKNYKELLQKAYKALESINEWDKENIDEKLLQVIKYNEFKTGDFFMDLRIAITGSKFTPPINDSIAILGKKETLDRIKTYL